LACFGITIKEFTELEWGQGQGWVFAGIILSFFALWCEQTSRKRT